MNEVGGRDFGSVVDPRMRGFKMRTGVAELSAWIADEVRPLEAEDVPLVEASGRVLAHELLAGGPVPPFDRSAMDGYALRAEETFSASVYTPAGFRCVGRSRPGQDCEVVVGTWQAVQIATGAPMPPGTDAVVPFEATRSEGEWVWVSEAITQGRNVSLRGEDIAGGAVVLQAGRRLRPQDLGVLSAIGRGTVPAIRRPRVAVLITGNELLSPGTPARAFQIPDANSVMIEALVARDGGTCIVLGPLPDDATTIRDAIVAVEDRADLLLVSGGSSAGPEDFVPSIIAGLGRLVAHGVALRPASPTGVGLIRRGTLPVVLLPGNPVSCLCAYDFFAGPIVRRLGGRSIGWPYRRVSLPLARKLTSVVGRVDYTRVRIRAGQVEPLSTSGASILSSVSRADGFVVIPTDREGYPAGAQVEVWCYDESVVDGNHAVEDPRESAPTVPDQSDRSAHQTPLG
jgi:molybdopterin molybdotransferase